MSLATLLSDLVAGVWGRGGSGIAGALVSRDGSWPGVWEVGPGTLSSSVRGASGLASSCSRLPSA